MKYYCYIIFFAFCLNSCYKELSDKEISILHDDEIPLFMIDSVIVIAENPVLEIRIFYSSEHSELTEEQQFTLLNTLVLRNGNNIDRKFIQSGEGSENQLFFFNDIVEPEIICYDFFLLGRTNDSIGRTRVTELCVDLSPG